MKDDQSLPRRQAGNLFIQVDCHASLVTIILKLKKHEKRLEENIPF